MSESELNRLCDKFTMSRHERERRIRGLRVPPERRAVILKAFGLLGWNVTFIWPKEFDYRPRRRR